MIGGAVAEDGVCGRKAAQTWELQHMCNDQFVWGSWEAAGVRGSEEDTHTQEMDQAREKQ